MIAAIAPDGTGAGSNVTMIGTGGAGRAGGEVLVWREREGGGIISLDFFCCYVLVR